MQREVDRPALLVLPHLKTKARLGLFVLAGLVIAALVVLTSAGAVLTGPAAPAAVAAGSFDAHAKADYAQLLLGHSVASAEKGSTLDTTAATRLANEAIRRSPLVPTAWRTLALARKLEKRPPASYRPLLEMSSLVSRRDVGTSLMLFEDHARQNQHKDAFRYLDLALRNSVEGRELFLPVMVTSLADADFRKLVGHSLAADRGWNDELYAQIGRAPPPSQVLVPFIQSLPPKAVTRSHRQLQLLAASLLQQGQFQSAGALSQRLGLGRFGLINGDFEASDTAPPFDWATQSTPTYDAVEGAYGGRIDGNRALYLRSSSSKPVEVARQVVFLPQGTYRLRANAGTNGNSSLSSIELAVVCAAGGSQSGGLLTSLEFALLKDRQSGQQQFTVPGQGCPAQWLMVTIAGKEGGPEASGWLDSVGLSVVSK